MNDVQPLTNVTRWTVSAWAILLFGITLLLSSSAQIAYRLWLPTDGWSWTSGAVGSVLEDTITCRENLLGQPSPLQAGDFVLAVDGHPYGELMRHATTFQPPLIHTWQAGHRVRYLVRRGNDEVLLAVPLYLWRIVDIVRLLFRSPATY